MAGVIFDSKYLMPSGRSDFLEVCDRCHETIWATFYGAAAETTDEFRCHLARKGWHEYFDGRRPCVPSETEKPAEHRVDMQTTTTGPARTSAIVPWKPKEGQQYEHGSRNRR